MLKQNQNSPDIIIRLSICYYRCDVKMTDDTSQSGQFRDRRAKSRSTEMTNPMAVISCPNGPLYQMKIRDLSYEGPGIVVRADSNLLKMIHIEQELNVRLILPRHYRGPSGYFRARVEHITEIQENRFKGHMIVGLFFLPRIN
jgi:hypothetical protein